MHGFRFDNFLVEHPMFHAVVEGYWSLPAYGSFMHRVLLKLKSLKKPLRRLRASYGKLSSRVERLKTELDAIQLACDLDPHNGELMEDLAHLMLAYQQARIDETSALKQRAKIKWLADGDGNTKFFHNAVKEKRNQNLIHSISDSNGQVAYGDDVEGVFLEHFQNFLGERDPSVDPSMDASLFSNRLLLSEALHMIRPISDIDIKDALFSIGNDKAPGSDGFSAKFFKGAWNIVGGDVKLAIHNFFYTGRLAKELNHTLVCLIPKKPNANSVSDFRPISCCTVLYKCISKIIAERMKPYLNQLISSNQSAFVPGRRISDNILIAHELVSGYHKPTGQPRCAFKIDLRKAYDMVDWKFILNMLDGLGFHPVFLNWIHEMLHTSSFSIAINGGTVGKFKGAM